jgi:hypothetical protein
VTDNPGAAFVFQGAALRGRSELAWEPPSSPTLRASHLPRGHVDAVVEVGHGDFEHEPCKRRLVVVPLGLIPDGVGHTLELVCEAGNGLG